MSETSSLRSSRSTGSRYRTVSRGSSIDKSLFGGKTRENLKQRHENQPNVITESEFHYIKGRSSPGPQKCAPRCIKTVHEDKSALERAEKRKSRMLSIESKRKAAESAKGNGTTTDSKARNIPKDDNRGKFDQSKDIVNLLNSTSQRAAAFTIRDKQLEDKKAQENREMNYEQQMDLSMEINRLKDIAAREAEENAKVKKRFEDRKVIEKQIKERAHQRLLQEEAREQENRMMLQQIKKNQDANNQKAAKRKEEAMNAQRDIIIRNEEIAAEKETQKELLKEEDALILAYQAERDEALRKREEEGHAVQKQKIEMQKALFTNQRKSMDKQTELDELRARRAAEEGERKHRKRDILEAQKKVKDMKILHETKIQQEEEKQRSKQKKIEQKQEEYESALRHAAEMAKRERDELEMTQRKNAELRTMLKQQIEEHENQARLHQQEKFEEGKKIKEKMALERVQLEAARQKMVQDMREKGINEKYFSEMMTIDIDKILTK